MMGVGCAQKRSISGSFVMSGVHRLGSVQVQRRRTCCTLRRVADVRFVARVEGWLHSKPFPPRSKDVLMSYVHIRCLTNGHFVRVDNLIEGLSFSPSTNMQFLLVARSRAPDQQHRGQLCCEPQPVDLRYGYKHTTSNCRAKKSRCGCHLWRTMRRSSPSLSWPGSCTCKCPGSPATRAAASCTR